MARWFVDLLKTEDGVNWIGEASWSHIDHEAARRQAELLELDTQSSVVIHTPPFSSPAPIAGQVVDLGSR
jgi:hypothetical protein